MERKPGGAKTRRGRYKDSRQKSMLRLPLPAIAVWLSLGILTGWWLHVLYQSPASLAPDPGTAGDSPGQALTRHENRSAELLRTEIETLMGQGNYERAFARFNEARTRDKHAARQNLDTIITALSNLNEKSPGEAQPLLRRFLENNTYDPRSLFLLSKSYFETNQHMRALETLFDLKSFNQNEVPGEDIDSLIEQAESKYATQLEENGRFGELLQLYRFLTERDPDNLARFYKIAEIQNHLRHYYDALTSLNYVLYDPTWGRLAQNLVDEIQQAINLNDEVQVPLKRDGEHFIVNASINGIEGARLVIDTGSSLCLLRPQAAQQFGLPAESDDYVTLNLVAGVLNAPRIEIEALSIGDAEVRNVKASVVEMPGMDSDGLLGMNFLSNFKFFIDQKREILYLGSR